MSKATRSTPANRQYLYGKKRTWEMVLDAVQSFERPVSAREVRQHIVNSMPNFVASNVGPDLSVLSVNCYSRGNYGKNIIPRRSDSGNPYDRLFKIRNPKGPLYSLYDSSMHGIWELAEVGDQVLRPRLLESTDLDELKRARDIANAGGLFDADQDARRRIMAAIVQREGQPAFRKALLEAYDGKCAISGCAIEALLEAAHIMPYRGVHTNHVGNGLLLRSDIHKLLDLHLISIDPTTRTILLNDKLRQSEYACFHDAQLAPPVTADLAPLAEALEHHHARCDWIVEKP